MMEKCQLEMGVRIIFYIYKLNYTYFLNFNLLIYHYNWIRRFFVIKSQKIFTEILFIYTFYCYQSFFKTLILKGKVMYKLIFINLFMFCTFIIPMQVFADDNPTPAPGRAEIPVLKNHYHLKPGYYDFSNIPVVKITDNIGFRFIMSTQSTMIEWTLKKGAKLPAHFHLNEQINIVESGKLDAFSDGKKYALKAGGIMVFPPNVPHEFVAVEDSVFLDIQTPARQDFLAPDFIEKLRKILSVK